ncbi:MAG: hypothetical protein P1V51_02370 [Deltaproteobacteria bacterium]|nr:hypothetical protein [Deltaproteobacteria bacterium]
MLALRSIAPLASLLTLTACVTTAPAPTALPEPEPIVLGLVRGAGEGSVPASVRQALVEALKARNLPVVSTWEGGADAPRATAGRVARLREAAAGVGAPHLLLVEVEPAFYAQLDGRYRWTVSVEVRAGAGADEGALQEESATLPVFLRFDHQREDAALEAAGPELRRVAMRALDAYLSAR